MGFPRQKYCSGLPFPSPGHLPDAGIEPVSPALAGGSFPLSHQGSPGEGCPAAYSGPSRLLQTPSGRGGAPDFESPQAVIGRASIFPTTKMNNTKTGPWMTSGPSCSQSEPEYHSRSIPKAMWPWKRHPSLPGLSLPGNEGKIPFRRGRKNLWLSSDLSYLPGDMLICSPGPSHAQNKLCRKVRHAVRTQKTELGLVFPTSKASPDLKLLYLHATYLYVGFVLAFVPLLHLPQVRILWKTQLTDYPRIQKSLCFHRERLPYPTRWYLACLHYCFTSHHLTQFRFSLFELETTLRLLGKPPLPPLLFSPPPFQKQIVQNRGNN